MTAIADQERTIGDPRKLRYDPETSLPIELGPFEIMGCRDKWAVVSWIEKGNWDDNTNYPTIWDAFEAMVRLYRRWHRTLPSPVVYFIGTELRVGGEVKVGFSRNVQSRLNALQTAHPRKLQIFATTPGSQDLEEKYHRRWRARRLGGEWFTIGDCIIKEIERLTNG